MKKYGVIFCIILGIAFLYSVLSIQKYHPSNNDAYINFSTAFIVSLGLFYVLFFLKLKYINYSALFFLYFSIVIAIQPIFNEITYLDNLIFPVVSLLLACILSIVIVNMKNEGQVHISTLAFFVTLSGVLLVCTQIIQLFDIESMIGELVFYSPKDRLISNVAQPNQAAYIMAMAIACCGYFWIITKKKIFQILSIVLVVFLGMGIGMSVSRGGIILGVAAVTVLMLFTELQIKRRILFSLVFLFCFLIGNFLGGELLKFNSSNAISNIERFSGSSSFLRVYLNQEAWLIFKNNWLFGAGWDNFSKAGLEYAEQLKWFTNAGHSHFFISQIAAELGVIGLVGLVIFGIILVKGIRFGCHPSYSLLLTVISICILYSCSEYPMWYFRYLFLFAIFLSLLDKSRFKISLNITLLLQFLLIIVLLGSSYYYINYKKYRDASYIIYNEKNSYDKREQAYKDLPDIFGFSDYKEFFLFVLLPVSEEQASKKAILGNRVAANRPHPPVIYKQPAILAFDHQFDKALVLFKAACLHRFANKCDMVESDLKNYSNQRPDLFSGIYSEFVSWRKENPEKTNLKTTEPSFSEPM